MKKIILAVAATLAFSFGAQANTFSGDLHGAGTIYTGNNSTVNVGSVNGSIAINGAGITVSTGQKGEQGIQGERGENGRDGVDGKDHSADIKRIDANHDKLHDAIADDRQHMGQIQERVEYNTSNIETNHQRLNGHDEDIDSLTKDNERQDANHQTLKDGVETWNKWAAQDSADQWGDINDLQDNKANKKDLDREVQDRIDGDKRTNDAIAKETTDRTNADAKLNAKVDNNQKQQQAVDNAQNSRIDTEVEDRKAADVVQQMRIDQANANIEANRQASVATNKRVAANSAAIANHEQRIGDLEKSTSKGFAELRSQIDDVKQDADAGIASVAAMANIPQVTEYQNLSVGAGVGVRNSQSAVAVGVSARLTENTVGKLSVASDSRSEFTAGAGISYGW